MSTLILVHKRSSDNQDVNLTYYLSTVISNKAVENNYQRTLQVNEGLFSPSIISYERTM
jgi:hypothetical protein